MSFLSNPHLDLTTVRIETERCILVPFFLGGVVDIHELTDEFCLANKNLYVSPILPTYEQELVFIRDVAEGMVLAHSFENFIIEKSTHRFIGAIGLNSPESATMNIGLWIREEEHKKGYATEVYSALLEWAKQYLKHSYLKHSTHPENFASRKLAEKFGGVLQTEKTERGHDIYYIPLR